MRKFIAAILCLVTVVALTLLPVGAVGAKGGASGDTGLDGWSPVELYRGGNYMDTYFSVQDALADYDLVTDYLKLPDDVEIGLVLEQDLYVDLNGCELAGQINCNGYGLYCMDSATNGYSSQRAGLLTATVTGGAPVGYFKTDAARTGEVYSYLSVWEAEGYSFHRVFLGITNVSLKPSVTGFGYKADFRADADARAQILSVGYELWLEGGKTVSCTMGYQNSVTLRLKHFDVVHYGDVPVNACAIMTLADGTVVRSTTQAYSMRQMLEIIDQNLEKDSAAYSQEQLKALGGMLAPYGDTVKNWNIQTILKSVQQ